MKIKTFSQADAFILGYEMTSLSYCIDIKDKNFYLKKIYLEALNLKIKNFIIVKTLGKYITYDIRKRNDKKYIINANKIRKNYLKKFINIIKDKKFIKQDNNNIFLYVKKDRIKNNKNIQLFCFLMDNENCLKKIKNGNKEYFKEYLVNFSFDEIDDNLILIRINKKDLFITSDMYNLIYLKKYYIVK